MNHRLVQKQAHYQAYIDTLVEECGFLECSHNDKEIECHLNVDLVLSEPNVRSHNTHKPKNNTEHHSTVAHHNSYQHNVKYEKKQNLLGGFLYSIFA